MYRHAAQLPVKQRKVRLVHDPEHVNTPMGGAAGNTKHVPVSSARQMAGSLAPSRAPRWRRVLPAARALCAVLSVLLVAAWFRSHVVGDQIRWSKRTEYRSFTFRLGSAKGSIGLRSGYGADAPGRTPRREEHTLTWTTSLPRDDVVAQNRFGAWWDLGWVPGAETGESFYSLYVTVPYGVLILLTGSWPLWWLFTRKRRRRRQRLAQGRCPNCNYDLRGDTGSARCPECGESISTNTATTWRSSVAKT
jgi:hypothetical protein